MQALPFLPIFALLTPFLLFPLELFFPFPFIFEEVAKAILISPCRHNFTFKTKGILALLVGVLFALSETVLYIFNIINYGSLLLFLERALMTILLHGGTSLLMAYMGSKGTKFFAVGILLAMAIHYLYNLLLSPF